MAFEPITLATPGILLDERGTTIWHSGVVLGPPGIVVFRLDIDWVVPGQWNDRGGHPVLPPPPPARPIQIVEGDRVQTLQLELDENGAAVDRGTTGQPVQAYIVTFGAERNEVVMGENGFSAGEHGLTFSARLPGPVRGRRGFPPLTVDQLAGGQLHVDIYPIEQHFVLPLNPQ